MLCRYLIVFDEFSKGGGAPHPMVMVPSSPSAVPVDPVDRPDLILPPIKQPSIWNREGVVLKREVRFGSVKNLDFS